MLVKFSVLKNNNQPEETDKMYRKINSQKGNLFFLLLFAKLFKRVKHKFSSYVHVRVSTKM